MSYRSQLRQVHEYKALGSVTTWRTYFWTVWYETRLKVGWCWNYPESWRFPFSMFRRFSQ